MERWMPLPTLTHREGVGLAVSGLRLEDAALQVSGLRGDDGCDVGASVVPMAKVFTDDAGGRGCG